MVFQMRLFAALLLLLSLLTPGIAVAQHQPTNIVGYWRCVSNSDIVSIDLQLQINPDNSLYGEGSIVYVQTSRIFNVRGPGRWLLGPPDASSPEYLYSFQLHPMDGNHAIFSIYARPTGAPNGLYNYWYNPQTGGATETSCQRLG
ncbi:MAG: hypothetical protein ABJL67_09885 [Sulfitobacter sp.]